MGTNYYGIKKSKKFTWNVKKIHIGKSSAGWKFLFYHYDELPMDFEKIKKIIREKYDIYDEYDRFISLDDFIEMVEEKQKNKDNKDHYGLDNNFKLDSKGYNFVVCRR